MKINVQYQKGQGQEQLVVWSRVKVVVGRALDGQIVRMRVPAYYLEWAPF